MSRVLNLNSRIIYDARGYPIVEVELQTVCGNFRSQQPVQPTFTFYDNVELRDADKFGSRGCSKALEVLRTKAKNTISNLEIKDIAEFDKVILELNDNVHNMGGIGTNVSLTLSMCATQAVAAYNRTPLYQYIKQCINLKTPMKYPILGLSLISGGHNGAYSFAREFYLVATSNIPILDQVQNYKAVAKELRVQLKNQYSNSHTGAYIVEYDNMDEIVKLVGTCIKNSGMDGKVGVIIDISACDFFNDKDFKYEVNKFVPCVPGKEKDKTPVFLSSSQMVEKYMTWMQYAPIIAYQDPFSYEDLGSYQELVKQVKNVKIFGCQMFSCKVDRLQQINKSERGQVAHGVTVKVTNVGLISKVFDFINSARDDKLTVNVTTNLGDGIDQFLTHLAVGCGAEYFFVGGLSRGERIEKINELLRMQDLLSDQK